MRHDEEIEHRGLPIPAADGDLVAIGMVGGTVLRASVAVMAAARSISEAWQVNVRRAARSERGASLVEYALLVALIAVVCIGAVTALGSTASTKFSKIGSTIGP